MLGRELGFVYPIWVWTVIFWGVGSLIVFYGFKVVCEIASDLNWLLIGFMLFTALILFPFIDWPSVFEIHPSGFVGSIGIVFFATTALTVLPDIRELAGRQQNQMRLGSAMAIIGAGALSWMFGVIIASVYPAVSGVEDIQKAFPQIFWWLIPLIGLLAVGTSFLTFTQALKNLLSVELKFQRVPAWITSIVLPMLLFVLVSQDFLKTIGFVGGVVTTFNGFIICLLYYKISKENLNKDHWFCRWFQCRSKNPRVMMVLLRFLPIPLALALMLIIMEQLITLF